MTKKNCDFNNYKDQDIKYLKRKSNRSKAPIKNTIKS